MLRYQWTVLVAPRGCISEGLLLSRRQHRPLGLGCVADCAVTAIQRGRHREEREPSGSLSTRAFLDKTFGTWNMVPRFHTCRDEWEWVLAGALRRLAGCEVRSNNKKVKAAVMRYGC